MASIERDKELDKPMSKISYPDEDRLMFWGTSYQFDNVFGPGTPQAKVRQRFDVRGVFGSILRYQLVITSHDQTAKSLTYLALERLSIGGRTITATTLHCRVLHVVSVRRKLVPFSKLKKHRWR